MNEPEEGPMWVLTFMFEDVNYRTMFRANTREVAEQRAKQMTDTATKAFGESIQGCELKAMEWE